MTMKPWVYSTIPGFLHSEKNNNLKGWPPLKPFATKLLQDVQFTFFFAVTFFQALV